MQYLCMKLPRGTHFLEDLANEWRNQYPVVEASACGWLERKWSWVWFTLSRSNKPDKTLVASGWDVQIFALAGKKKWGLCWWQWCFLCWFEVDMIALHSPKGRRYSQNGMLHWGDLNVLLKRIASHPSDDGDARGRVLHPVVSQSGIGRNDELPEL